MGFERVILRDLEDGEHRADVRNQGKERKESQLKLERARTTRG